MMAASAAACMAERCGHRAARARRQPRHAPADDAVGPARMPP